MTALSIQRTPSLRLAALLSLAHSAAVGSLWPLTLPWSIKAMIMVALAISLAYYLRQDALLSADNAVIAFVLSDEMQCIVTVRSGESMICNILGNTFVAPYLTVLNLKPVGKFFTRSIVILPDGVDAEEFRQLRVWLRWKWKDNSEIG